MTSPGELTILALHEDALSQVFSFLYAPDLCHVSEVCKIWNKIANMGDLWHNLFRLHCEVIWGEHKTESATWKQWYAGCLQNVSMSPEHVRIVLEGGSFMALGDAKLQHVPVHVWFTENLRHLNLQSNKLTELTGSFHLMADSLEVLNVAANSLKELPPNIGDLRKMRCLFVDGNELQELPSSIGRLSNLEVLDISNNAISTLPRNLFRCSSLVKLLCSNNAISVIPPLIAELSALEEITFVKNCLTRLPPELGYLVHLKNLNVASNRIVFLPHELSRLPVLERFNYADNLISVLPIPNKDTFVSYGNPLVVTKEYPFMQFE